MRSSLHDNPAEGFRPRNQRLGGDRLVLTGDVVLPSTASTLQFLDTGGVARTVTMPELALGRFFIISNVTDSGDPADITINDAGGVNITTLSAGEAAILISSDSEWEQLKALVNLDVFGASGPDHSNGLVPSPGPNAGSTRFLREDATWAEKDTIGVQDAFVNVTDGTETAVATGDDTLKVRSDDGTIRVVVTNDHATHGDTILFEVDTAVLSHDALADFVADEHVAHSGVVLTAGDGLTGGGDITASRSFAIDTTWVYANIDHDQLLGFVANEHIDHSGVSVSAGEGLTGGGDLTASRTFALDILGLTDDSAPSLTADYVAIESSGAGLRRTAIFNILGQANPGIPMDWDSGTTDADPGAGNIRANDAALGSATELYVSKSNRGGSDISAFLATLDDSTSTPKGSIVLVRTTDSAVVTFEVTSLTDATGYVKLGVQTHSGETSLSDTDPLAMQFYAKGDAGSGSGDVTGPASSVDSAIVLFDGTTGKTIKDSAKTIVTALGADDTTVPTSKAVKDVTDAHAGDTANPHSVTKSQVGLGNVTNDAQLAIANNLSDVANADTARDNLDAEQLGVSPSDEKTASYTLVATDKGKLIRMNVSSANNLTVPANASVAFELGTRIEVAQWGAGQTTLVEDTGVTIRSRNGLLLAGQYAGCALRKIATDEWLAVGDLTT